MLETFFHALPDVGGSDDVTIVEELGQEQIRINDLQEDCSRILVANLPVFLFFGIIRFRGEHAIGRLPRIEAGLEVTRNETFPTLEILSVSAEHDRVAEV